MSVLRLRYQTVEFDNHDIHLCTLFDNNQFSDPTGAAEALGISSALWPIFGVMWPSGMALAHYMDSYATEGKRILEVGCGIGLPSLLLNAKHADITATDYHPEVNGFLTRNALLNNNQSIEFERTDWADKNDKLGLFDLIIGSDLLYEDQHTSLLAEFIATHANTQCEVIMVDPGRGRKSRLEKALISHGFECIYQPLPENRGEAQEYKGHILKFSR